MHTYAIVVAGGKGKRFGGEKPKQFIELQGKPILMHTIEKIKSYCQDIQVLVVLPEEQISVWKEMCKELEFRISHNIVAGGEERFFSVKNAIDTLSKTNIADNDLVAIHDGVRPFANQQTWINCIKTAKEKGNAVPCMPSVESLRKVDGERNHAIDRSRIHTIQTPQVFRFDIIKQAYKQVFSTDFTDDASVVESLGEKIYLVEGNRENIKITTPFDLKIAQAILSN